MWSVYIILTRKNRFYTGISTDIERRFQQHLNGRGAKFFRGDGPIRIVFRENGLSRSEASKREASIKKLSRAQKERLIQESEKLVGK